MRPNVEVTGAARLYRAASVWTAGLGSGMNSLSITITDSAKVGAGKTAIRSGITLLSLRRRSIPTPLLQDNRLTGN